MFWVIVRVFDRLLLGFSGWLLRYSECLVGYSEWFLGKLLLGSSWCLVVCSELLLGGC